MFYLLFQMLLYMLVTLALGIWLGWLLWRRGYIRETMRAIGFPPPEGQEAHADSSELQAAYDTLKSENARISGDLSNANAERNRLQNDLDACMAARQAAEKKAAAGAVVAAAPKTVVAKPEVVSKPAAVVSSAVTTGTKPTGLKGPRGGKSDDLKEIKGIGPKLEKMLHGMGFYHFDQIAGWGASELAWVDENLEGFKGRASRDEWVRQAKALA